MARIIRRRAARKIDAAVAEEVSLAPQIESPNFIEKFRKQIIVVLLAIIVLSVLFFIKSWFVVAVVNNKPISRSAFNRELIKRDGKAVLDNQIVQALILQEAQKQKIVIKQQEIDDKIKEIEKTVEAQGQKLDALLAVQGETKQSLGEQLRLQLIVEKILRKDISITDQEISDYFNQNKSSYPKDTKLEDKKEEIKNALFQQTLNTKISAWVEDLKKNAKIYYFIRL